MGSWGNSPTAVQTVSLPCAFSHTLSVGQHSPEPPTPALLLRESLYSELTLPDPLSPCSYVVSPAHQLVQLDPCKQSDTWTAGAVAGAHGPLWAEITGVGLALLSLHSLWALAPQTHGTFDRQCCICWHTDHVLEPWMESLFPRWEMEMRFNKNYRIVEVWRDLWRCSGPTPLSWLPRIISRQLFNGSKKRDL